MDRDRPAAGYTRDDRCVAIVIGEAATCRDALAAIALIGGRSLSRIGWDAVADDLIAPAVRAILLVEAEGIGDAVLDQTLPRIDAFAAALEMPVIVSFAQSQIDVVAAHLLGRHVQLLCAPSMAERVAALAVAAELSGPPSLSDPWRESEGARLQRLNEEVARIADILARLTRDEPLDDVEDRRRRFDAGPIAGAAIDPVEIRRMIRARRLRDQFLGGGLFEDPAWDMLLDLFAAELEQNRVSVSSLCIAAAVAPTTALRWISKLSEQGLFVRQPDPQDRRRAFMALSTRTSEAMRGYMAASRRVDLGMV
jgi:DNA-binding MarR family transcriptional regulator